MLDFIRRQAVWPGNITARSPSATNLCLQGVGILLRWAKFLWKALPLQTSVFVVVSLIYTFTNSNFSVIGNTPLNITRSHYKRVVKKLRDVLQ
jgi:hypothetical protein